MIHWLRVITLSFLLLAASSAIAQQSEPAPSKSDAPPPPRASPKPTAEPIAAPSVEPDRIPWLLIAAAVLAVAAALAAAHKVREHRRIARTRAALGLSPSLDPADGSGSASGLSLAKPPITIRTRLEWGAIQHG